MRFYSLGILGLASPEDGLNGAKPSLYSPSDSCDFTLVSNPAGIDHLVLNQVNPTFYLSFLNSQILCSSTMPGSYRI
jgi:hypothetical protein